MTSHTLALALGMAFLAPPDAPARPFVGPPRVVADQGGYTSCAFTADGTAIICSRVNTEEVAQELWRMELAGSEKELIGHGRQPSVQGSLLAYVGTEPGMEGIWLRRLDSDEPPRPVDKSVGYEWPIASPDGKTVAAAAGPQDSRGGIYLFHLDGRENAWLVRQGESQPAYSADGASMLMTRGKQIWLLGNLGTPEQILDDMLTEDGREHLDPKWGPRGVWITFAGRWNERFSNIGLLHLDSGRLYWLTEGLTGARSPVISPSGDKLVYLGACGEDTAVYVRDLRLP